MIKLRQDLRQRPTSRSAIISLFAHAYNIRISLREYTEYTEKSLNLTIIRFKKIRQEKYKKVTLTMSKMLQVLTNVLIEI